MIRHSDDARTSKTVRDGVPPSYDIAAASLEHAIALPGMERLDIAQCLRWVDDAATRVGFETERHLYRLHKEPEKYNHSEGVFRMMWLVTVLQRDLHVHYRQETIELSDHDFFRDAANLFIHGIVEGEGGTCSSLPVLFAAVGRRLGYPLKLVKCKKHCFLRWEVPGSERFNIETTSRGFVSHSDAYYEKWPFEATAEEIRKYRYLQSETPEEEVATFLCMRALFRKENGSYGDAAFEFLRAFLQTPGSELIAHDLRNTLALWGRELLAQSGQGFPGITICKGPRWHYDLDINLALDLSYLNVLEKLLNDHFFKSYWWEPLRRDRRHPPSDMPEWIRATYLRPSGAGPIKFEPCEKPRIQVY